MKLARSAHFLERYKQIPAGMTVVGVDHCHTRSGWHLINLANKKRMILSFIIR